VSIAAETVRSLLGAHPYLLLFPLVVADHDIQRESSPHSRSSTSLRFHRGEMSSRRYAPAHERPAA